MWVILETRTDHQAFPTTRWSLVVATSGADRAREALAELCGIYWPPVYSYLRGRTDSREDAEDLTQGFFESLLERSSFTVADPEKGRMRSFLRVAAKRFMINQSERKRAAKRGGGLIPDSLAVDELEARLPDTSVRDPEREFDRSWAMVLLENVLTTLESEYEQVGKAEVFAALKPALSPSGDTTKLGVGLNLNQGAQRVAVHRLRRRYRELLRAAIAETVTDPSEVDGEIHYLMELFSDSS